MGVHKAPYSTQENAMAQVHKTDERTGKTAKVGAGKVAVGKSLYAYALKGGQSALAGMTLPASATIAIISPEREGKVLERSDRVVLYGEVRPQRSYHRAIRVQPGRGRTDIDTTAFEPDARSRALLRGIHLAQEDLREAGGAYDLDEVRTMMHGVSRQAVDKRVREGKLLAVPGPNNRRRYPTVQFTPDGSVVDGLREVGEALPSRNPWVMLNFLVNPDDRLQQRRPIDLLKAGELGSVIEAAKRIGEQGA
jgi:hypothetical protein